MSENKIKTKIQCQNIAPIINLSREITSNSLKIGVFANNGSGKTFISRLFRLTEKTTKLTMDLDGKSPTDKFLTFGKTNGNFEFTITGTDGIIKENFAIQIIKGSIPLIPTTEYLYHTFNQDYVEENIQALNYEKDSEIEGFILGKINIDLKDDEERLLKIEKQGTELSRQVETDIIEYVDDNISDIQNIKRLSEYKILDHQNIFNGIDREKYDVQKSFTDLLEDYNKIKSVPENLGDIQKIEKINVDLKLLNGIQILCKEEFSLSSLAEDFKQKIKAKQDFIETGIELLKVNSENEYCPFCEQKLETNALLLIDQYTKYLSDTEAKTIKTLKGYIESLEIYIEEIKKSDNTNAKRINEFNSYKKKYIPSSQGIELSNLETKNIIKEINILKSAVQEKIRNISISIIIQSEQLQSIESSQSLLNRSIDQNNQEIEAINFKKNRIGEENKDIRREICKCVYNYLVDLHKNNIKTVIKLRNDWKQLNEEINKKKEQQKVSKRVKVAETIKKVLNYFFADKYSLDEDTFRLVFEKNILEKNQARNVLSEGEKNIVAFAYFIGDTHLKVERDDDYEKLFFIIDDPISSMDFSHVYTLCGVIRDLNKIIDKLQRERLFIFTHNNDFMRVVTTNNIVDKKLLLKNNELKDFNNNVTVPYINHLLDIYNIARKGIPPSHTTANSIRHIFETLTKFEKIEISSDSIADYIREHIPNDAKSYTLINDLSHGGWRSEQSPITEDDYSEICETIIKHLETTYVGQIEYCKKICN
jgi:wobble nucleotide-excising tRNase